MYQPLSPQLAIDSIKENLLQKKEEIERQLGSLVDSSLGFDVAPEPSEFATDAWLYEVRNRTSILKTNLKNFSEKIDHTLERIDDGSYGICENCGQNIDEERLQALPTAALCRSCV